MEPPTDSMVCWKPSQSLHLFIETFETLTNGEAVGPSKMLSSSIENGNRGTMTVLRGTINKITTGNPIAAIRIVFYQSRPPTNVALKRRLGRELTNGLGDRKCDPESNELDHYE